MKDKTTENIEIENDFY